MVRISRAISIVLAAAVITGGMAVSGPAHAYEDPSVTASRPAQTKQRDVSSQVPAKAQQHDIVRAFAREVAFTRTFAVDIPALFEQKYRSGRGAAMTVEDIAETDIGPLLEGK